MPRGNVEVSVPAVSMARRLVVRLPSRNAARLSSESCAAFQSMPRENIEVSIPDSFHGAAARCPSAEQKSRASFVRILCGISVNAAGGTLKLAFRTLSMAQRRIERLQGVQFCRRTTEIRSEVSRPPDLFRTASPRNRKVSSLLLSGFGRARGYGKRFWAFSRACSAPFRWIGTSTRPIIDHRVRSRWALPKPAKEP